MLLPISCSPQSLVPCEPDGYDGWCVASGCRNTKLQQNIGIMALMPWWRCHLKRNLVALKTEPRTSYMLVKFYIELSPTLPPNILKKYYFKIRFDFQEVNFHLIFLNWKSLNVKSDRSRSLLKRALWVLRRCGRMCRSMQRFLNLTKMTSAQPR